MIELFDLHVQGHLTVQICKVIMHIAILSHLVNIKISIYVFRLENLLNMVERVTRH